MNRSQPPTRPRSRPGHRPLRARLLAGVCALVLAGHALAPPAMAQGRLPALGDATSDDFGVGTERRLGDQIMREIRRDPDYLDDPLLLEYLQSLWLPLIQQARTLGHVNSDLDSHFAWEAFLVRDRSVNAFALPGGFIGVHLGLIALTATRDELASVLAHELVHVTQRHIARSIVNTQRLTLLNAAAMLLGVLAASRSRSADAANAVIAGGQAATLQGQLNFSRDMEREADRIGIAMLAGSGYTPAGMASMFEKLDQSSRFNDSGGYPYLRSHPLNTERIGAARARADRAGDANTGDLGEHRIAQARARVMMDTRADALRRLQSLDGERGAGGLDALSATYASALASTLLRDWPRADAALAQTQALWRDKPGTARVARAFYMLEAQSLLARGDATRAAAALRPLEEDLSRPVMLMQAQVAVALAGSPAASAAPARLQRSAEALQTHVALSPRDATAWSALAQVWGAMNHPLRALRADAESRLATGDVNGAIDRLMAARREARASASADFIEASVVDARLRDLEGLRRRQAEEERNQR